MPAIMTPPETRTRLSGISWETYKKMLEELGDHRNERFAYFKGELEIMSPGSMHEGANRTLDKMIFALCEETRRYAKDLGSLTCNREDLQLGMEPDSCYYFENAKKLRKGEQVDLNIDPPPDLMVEVDVSRSSMKKAPILAALGVPEWWRYDGEKLEILVLKNGQYEKSAKSNFFPQFDIGTQFVRFLNRCDEIGNVEMMLEFRQWVRESMKTQ
jgi:Uma2 family endonuclease